MPFLSQLAYIDPGSGSLLFQALLSFLLTAIIFFKRVILFIKRFFNHIAGFAKQKKIR